MASVHDLLEHVLLQRVKVRSPDRRGLLFVFVALALLAAAVSYNAQGSGEAVKPVPEQLRQRSIEGPDEYPRPERARLV